MIARCPSAVRILHRPNTIFRLSGLGHCAPSLQHHHGGGLPAPAHSRTFSSSSPTASTGQTQDVRGSGPLWSSKRWKPFDDLAAHLDEIAPRFEINAGQIEILREPKDFYDVLKNKILGAKRRIFFSTLYVGKTENELIQILHDALQKNPSLSLSILTDAIRGTREDPKPSCASLLAPLINTFGPERVQVRMYHTPNLTGIRKRILPKRINEGWGLQHMKIYGFDEEQVMLSGANLSKDYFTNRQDRYHLFHSNALAKYYERIHDAVCEMSYAAQPLSSRTETPEKEMQRLGTKSAQFKLVWPSSNSGPAPLDNPGGYIDHATQTLTPLIQPSTTNASLAFQDPDQPQHVSTEPHQARPQRDTLVYPLFQFAPLFHRQNQQLSTELPAMRVLLRALKYAPFSPTRWTFTAGYFNMGHEVRDLLLSSLSDPPKVHATSSKTAESSVDAPQGDILTAHPHANGFYPSTGISSLLPPAYTHLAQKFLREVRARHLDTRVRLREWKRGVVGQKDASGREGWTYHAKGIWVTLPSHDGPSVTLIGSSNYTKRSHTLDTEANALVLTTSAELRGRLGEEVRWLERGAGEKVEGPGGFVAREGEERRVRWWVKVALWVVGVVGGAL